MLMFYQIFNIVLFGLLSILSMWTMKGKIGDIMQASPIPFPEYVYYGIICLEIFIIFVVAAAISGSVCWVTSCFL